MRSPCEIHVVWLRFYFFNFAHVPNPILRKGLTAAPQQCRRVKKRHQDMVIPHRRANIPPESEAVATAEHVTGTYDFFFPSFFGTEFIFADDFHDRGMYDSNRKMHRGEREDMVVFNRFVHSRQNYQI